MDDSNVIKLYKEIYGKKPTDEQLEKINIDLGIELIDYIETLMNRVIPKKIDLTDLSNMVEEKDLLIKNERFLGIKNKKTYDIDIDYLIRKHIFNTEGVELIFEKSLNRIVEKYVKKMKEEREDSEMVKL